VIMTEALRDAAEFGNENPFQAGRAAMGLTHLWYQCCASPADADGNIIGDPDWDIAVVPSYNGTTTAPLNADTFAIPKNSKNPDTAFAALTYLIGDASDTLLNIYGGMPARPEKQQAFLDTLAKSEGFPESGAYLGPEGMNRYMRTFLEAWEQVTIEADELTGVGDCVVAEVTQRGVGRGSAAETEFAYFQVWTFRGESVIRIDVSVRHWSTSRSSAGTKVVPSSASIRSAVPSTLDHASCSCSRVEQS